MSSIDEKGNFTADISQDAINEALEAVERREKGEEAGGAEVEGTGTPPPAAPADPRAAELEELKAEVELSQSRGRDLMQKLKDEHEKLLRTAADLENYKRRAQKEKEEIQKYGAERMLRDLLPVYDNFDRALEHARSSADFESLKKGVEMTRKLLEDALGKHGVKTFSAKGQAFDPNRHEAMSAVETTLVPPNHVHTEVLKGFTLNERLMRPALVVVSRAPEEAPAPAAPPAEPAPEGDGSGGAGAA
jgi:molecular chaperone GrpE